VIVRDDRQPDRGQGCGLVKLIAGGITVRLQASAPPGAHRRARPCAECGVVMLPTNGVRIFVATRPVDFRKGHDGLAVLVQNMLRENPFSGTVFVFRAKRTDRLELLYWDGSGLVMAYKRLEEGSFTWPGVTDGVMRLSWG